MANAIVAAAGKSTNVELFLAARATRRQRPVDGARNARGRSSGALCRRTWPSGGSPDFCRFCQKHLGHQSRESRHHPRALEFSDGKLMLGEPAAMEELTYARLIDNVGRRLRCSICSPKSDLIALVNSDADAAHDGNVQRLARASVAQIAGAPAPLFLPDLADPAKRPREELRAGLEALAKFQHLVTSSSASISPKASKTAAVLDIPFTADFSSEGVRQAAVKIREKLGINCVVIHPLEGAACVQPATAPGGWTARIAKNPPSPPAAAITSTPVS